jgi:tetratricopeptide (TPR) repeat protein
VTIGHFGQSRIYLIVCLLALTPAPTQAQSPEPAPAVTVQGTFQGNLQGYVRDSSGRPLANATVFLEPATAAQTLAKSTQTAHTGRDGQFSFGALPPGAYTLRAEMNGYGGAAVGPLNLASKQTKKVDLVLVSSKAEAQSATRTEGSGKPAAPEPEFFDEPQFTVAGVSPARNAGGHGSDTVLRTSEALAKATVSLSSESTTAESTNAESKTAESTSPASPAGSTASISAATESTLRDAVAHNPKDAALHHQLGEVDEKLGNPLEAVREYQRAAELDSSEPNLFDWGTELLTHRALEPATEVFTKGNRLFPKSARMLIAIGVSLYARGSYDEATRSLVKASDLAPGNPTPYLFLGRMQSVQATPSEDSVEKLRRFAQLQPDNALANYYYAVSLWKESVSAADSELDTERMKRVESLLQKATRLDPKLGAAYLQLGILYSQRADFSRAISAYQKAIEVSPEEARPRFATPQLDERLDEAHYRLAQAYLRTGDKAKAKEELQIRDEISKKIKEDTARERREIQEFVISLRNPDSAPQ